MKSVDDIAKLFAKQSESDNDPWIVRIQGFPKIERSVGSSIMEYIKGKVWIFSEFSANNII